MIKLILMDVDGTMTDGGIYKGNNNEEYKKFDVKDGYIIVNSNKYLNKKFGIITGKKSEIVKNRAEELKIEILYQGISNKVDILNKILQEESIKPEEVAYIGDDLNDIGIIEQVGISGAPCNAVDEVLEIVDFISSKSGGKGAVREFVEHIIKIEDKWEEFLKMCK